MDGWQRLYQRASGAITRFVPGVGREQVPEADARELTLCSSG
ncbi:hypothetical protein [Geoalkalibacter subterraneus]|nr:hypothetical protein [Geoalkalibacter subterraneus]